MKKLQKTAIAITSAFGVFLILCIVIGIFRGSFKNADAVLSMPEVFIFLLIMCVLVVWIYEFMNKNK
jgi:putative Mn2+ efflux pump MntP